MNDKVIQKAIMVPLQGPSKISPFPAGKLENSLAWMNENGFTGVEPVLSEPDAVNVKDLKKTFDHHHLKTTTIVTGQTGEGLSLCSADLSVRENTIKRLYSYLDFASELESMVTIGLIKGTCAGEEVSESMKRLTGSLERLVLRAERLGVTLLLEPINHTKAAFLNSSTEVMEYIAQYFKGASIKILWDSFQANIEDYHMTDVLDDIAPRLGHVHFADSNRKFPGLGNIDFVSIYQKLCSIGYNGYITLECYNKPDGQYILDHAWNLFDKLENSIK